MFEDVPAVFVVMAAVMIIALAWGGYAIEGLGDAGALEDGDAD